MGKNKKFPSERLKTEMVLCVYESLLKDINKQGMNGVQIRQKTVTRLNSKPMGRLYRIKTRLRKERNILPEKV